jgi:hypothetical protein
MQSIFALLITELPPGIVICSSSEFAAAAWQHKLRKWYTELDELIEEYPRAISIPELEASHHRSLITVSTIALALQSK